MPSAYDESISGIVIQRAAFVILVSITPAVANIASLLGYFNLLLLPLLPLAFYNARKLES